MHLKPITGLAAFLILAGVSVNGCGACRPNSCPEDRYVDMDFVGQCIASVERHGARIEIGTRRECPWERLVNLDVFRGFRPGMSYA